MSRLIRPLFHSPLLHRNSPTRFSLNLLSSSLIPSSNTTPPYPSFSPTPSSTRSVHHRLRALRQSRQSTQSDTEDVDKDGDSDSDERKSRNQKKREARRAVRWGMDLAAFSPPQIKRIIKVASLDQDLFDALMLLKRMGPDVREGKRRQHNFIGKLLRDVEPELMDAAIQATREGDWSRLQGFPVVEAEIIEDEDDNEESGEDETEEEEYSQGSDEHVALATRWFDGLVNKDIEVSNEVYAIRTVEFDRQELRKLVRRVHAVHEQQVAAENAERKTESEIRVATKSLTRFLCALAKNITKKEEITSHEECRRQSIIVSDNNDKIYSLKRIDSIHILCSQQQQKPQKRNSRHYWKAYKWTFVRTYFTDRFYNYFSALVNY